MYTISIFKCLCLNLWSETIHLQIMIQVDEIQKTKALDALLEAFGGDIVSARDALTRFDQVRRRKLDKDKKVDIKLGPVLIDVRQATKSYKIGGQLVQALRSVDLKICEGEFVAITGTSGSGKSTLLQMIGGLDSLTSGLITVDGQNLSKLSDRKLSRFRNKTIGFVFQFFYLQPFLSLQRNIEVPAMFARKDNKSRRSISDKNIDTVGLSDRKRHLPNELSGGQMQRAAIARALQNNPKLILADEPTGNLDQENAQAIMDLFESVRREYGTTVILVTHDRDLALSADREISLRDGEIIS